MYVMLHAAGASRNGGVTPTYAMLHAAGACARPSSLHDAPRAEAPPTAHHTRDGTGPSANFFKQHTWGNPSSPGHAAPCAAAQAPV